MSGNLRVAAVDQPSVQHALKFRSTVAMERSTYRRILLKWCLHASALLFVLGVTLPVFSLIRLGFFSDTYSILTGALAAFEEGQWLLAFVIVLFSVLFPAYKLYRLYRASYAGSVLEREKALRLLDKIGKWSMLDVFVVAVLVASLKATFVASIEVHVGLYAFAASVLLSMVVTSMLRRQPAPADEE